MIDYDGLYDAFSHYFDRADSGVYSRRFQLKLHRQFDISLEELYKFHNERFPERKDYRWEIPYSIVWLDDEGMIELDRRLKSGPVKVMLLLNDLPVAKEKIYKVSIEDNYLVIAYYLSRDGDREISTIKLF